MHIGSIGIIISSFNAGGEALLVSTALTAGGIQVWRVLDGGGLPAVRDTTGGMFAVTYVPFMAGVVMLLLCQPNGPRRAPRVVVLAAANGGGGVSAGSLFGRQRMPPCGGPR